MFTNLRIRNFKAWKNTGHIRLAPLTVFFGTNSSGKTSLLQMLLMLKQTVQSPDRQRVLHLGDSNTPVDLGTFHDIVFGHDLSEDIEFSFHWRAAEPIPVPSKLRTYTYDKPELGFWGYVGTPGRGREQAVVKRMTYALGGLNGPWVGMEPRSASAVRYNLIFQDYRLVPKPGRGGPLPPPVRFYGFPNEVEAYYKNTGFVADLVLALEKQFGALYYLGPLRDYPKRAYTWSGETPEHVGWRGERAVEALLAARDRHISAGPHKRGQPFEAVIARWLQTMGLVESFEARPIAKHRKEYEVQVKTAGSRQKVNLTDVGFGISQVLPVLVESFHAPAGSTIIFEQPEIHLHPSVQAAQADLFIEVIRAREHGRDRNIQLIVESHSEHFLRRLQRRIAEEELDPNDAALYFCEPGPEGSTIRSLEVDAYGNISNWPANFFGDDLGDLAAMTEAAMRRQGEDDGE